MLHGLRSTRTAIVALFAIASCIARARADSIVSLADVYRAIDSANSVVVSAYSLSPRSAMLRHLEHAAERGARVQLVLTGNGMGYAVADNRAIVASERTFHITLSRRPIHLKAVVLDGGRSGVFLSDRNFTRKSLVVLLPPQYAQSVERAMVGDVRSYNGLTLTKGTSLQSEASVIARARNRIDIQTESFSDGNDVYDALETALHRHVRVAITVAPREYDDSPRERDGLAELQRLGATRSFSSTNEKLLCIDGGRLCWVGSSNATSGLPNQIDWGYITTSRSLVQDILDHLNQ